jgi:hypothetical protein
MNIESQIYLTLVLSVKSVELHLSPISACKITRLPMQSYHMLRSCAVFVGSNLLLITTSKLIWDDIVTTTYFDVLLVTEVWKYERAYVQEYKLFLKQMCFKYISIVLTCQCLLWITGCDNRSALDRHLISHTKERKHVCDQCPKTFLLKSHLNSHLRGHKVNPRSHECNVCLKKFFDRKSLLSHLPIHAAQAPFECNVCQNRWILEA